VNKPTSIFALVGAPLIVAVVFLGLAASAIAGDSNFSPDRTMYYEGTGQALIYPLWIADGNTDTLFEVTNRLTRSPNSGSTSTTTRKARWLLVHVLIHEEKTSEDVADFNVCLSPGDAWSAKLTKRADGLVAVQSADKSLTDLGPAPVDFPLNPQATRGYLSMVMVDNGTSPGAACDFSHESGNDQEPSQPDDASFTDNFQGTVNPLFGRSFYITLGTGLATGFNAEAIEEYCAGDGSNCNAGATVKGSIRAFQALALGDAKRSVRGTLLGRWIRDASQNFDTQLVVTWPTGKLHQFGVCSADPSAPGNHPFGTTNCGGFITTQPLDFRIQNCTSQAPPSGGTTMALWIRNDEECVNISPRQIPVCNEVNIISFLGLPNVLFNTTSTLGGGTCGAGKAQTPATGGWFRLMFDGDEDEHTDAVTGGGGDINVPPTTTVKVPRVIPAVGFVTLQGLSPSGARLSTTFPFQSERPLDFYNCDGNLFCDN